MISSYKATYNSGYSQANMGLAAKKLHRSKEKSCGYYMRIILFFSSLIQSLIIVSLVLFLVYGEPPQSIDEKRIKDLEQSYSRLTLENIALRAKEKNLTQQLNITLTAKKLGDKELLNLRKLANFSHSTINTLRTKWAQCEMEKKTCIAPRMPCPLSGGEIIWKHRSQQSEELLKLLRTNFTEQVRIMKLELDNTQKDRIRYQLEGIELRREKTFLEERIDMYERKCKEDFIQSLEGIPNVTREFLKRVDELFSKHISFQLTCEKQGSQLENIRANCSSLSMEVENKLQSYLDKVGSQVTVTLGENARCTTENKRLKQDATWCNSNRTEIIAENKKVLKQTQQTYDKEVERLLLDITKLNGKQKLQDSVLSVKEIEIKMLSENVKDLNTSLSICKNSQFPGGPSSSFLMPGMTFGHNRLGPGSTGSAGSWSMGSMGSTFGTGLGSAGLGNTGHGASPSSGTGLGSLGLGLQKPGSANTMTSGLTGFGQPSIGSSGGVPGYSSMGPGGAGPGSAATSSLALGRTGPGAPNTAGASSITGGKTASELLSAQLNQHLRELHQYAKTK